MNIMEVLQRFPGAKPARKYRGQRTWLARCPAHNDSTPSLSITEGRKRAFVHCFAGCDEAAILSAARLPDLWYEGARSRRAVAR